MKVFPSVLLTNVLEDTAGENLLDIIYCFLSVPTQPLVGVKGDGDVFARLTLKNTELLTPQI